MSYSLGHNVYPHSVVLQTLHIVFNKVVIERVTQTLWYIASRSYANPHESNIPIFSELIQRCLVWFQLLTTHYTPSQRGNYHHSMFHNPTAAVNLFHVGKQYPTFCKAEAAVTHNLIGRKIIPNVKHSDARNSLPILDVIRSSHKRHSAPEYCK